MYFVWYTMPFSIMTYMCLINVHGTYDNEEYERSGIRYTICSKSADEENKTVKIELFCKRNKSTVYLILSVSNRAVKCILAKYKRDYKIEIR